MKRQSIAQQFASSLVDRSYPRLAEHRHVSAGNSDTIIHFGRFCIRPRTRQFLAEGKPVEVGSRAFDLLMVLVEARGELVSNDEIMDSVWPTTLVGETNLRVQISLLRKALGKDGDVIKNVPGRGYVFVAPVSNVPQTGCTDGSGSKLVQDRQVPPPTASSMLARRSIEARTDVRHKKDRWTVAVIDDDPDVREALMKMTGRCIFA